MQNINGNKLFGYPERLCGDYRPITADIFLTNFCNNRCSWCTYNRWEKGSQAVGMSFADFQRYAERLRDLGVEGVILTGGGEPTLNKDFDRITSYLEENKIHYGINTNFNILKYFSPDYLKISLDGYSEKSYEAVRGVRAYEKTVENIKKYTRWNRLNGSKTAVGIQAVVTRAEDVNRFYDANRGLDVDYIVFRPVESTCGAYYFDDERLKEAEKAVEKIRQLEQIDSRVTANYKWSHLQTGFSECSAHWAQIAVDEKGNVIYCCHKPYEVVGHIMDDGILEKYAKVGTKMFQCDIPCRMTAPNLSFEMVKGPKVNKQFI